MPAFARRVVAEEACPNAAEERTLAKRSQETGDGEDREGEGRSLKIKAIAKEQDEGSVREAKKRAREREESLEEKRQKRNNTKEAKGRNVDNSGINID